ncbi:MAG: TonB family protein [Bacteroidia bacterium]|nr:TonB family protein [Bacteroidia bacterium]
MEIKKIKSKDGRTYRTLFFLIGMCISLGGVYALMEYKRYEKIEVANLDMIYDENEVEVEQTQQEEEPPPKEEIPQDPIIEVVDDEVEVEEEVDIDIETDDDESFGEVEVEDEGPEETDEVFKWYQVQEKAKFPGGDAAMDRFIDDNIVIPDIAYEEAESGTVLVGFTVEKNGQLTNIRILSKRKIGYGVEEAAIKVIKKMPRWTPALQRDKPARMAFTKPIRLNFN